MLSRNNIIAFVMDRGLDKINRDLKELIPQLFKQATDGEHRTVKIVVYEDNNPNKIVWQQGLAEQKGQIVKISVPTYTVTYKFNTSSWLYLILQKRTFKDLFWSSKLEAEGDYFVRDYIIWSKFWNQYKDFVTISGIERAFIPEPTEDL